MTRLTFGQSVKRETAATYAGRPVCIEVQSQLLVFRLKGTKTRYTLSVVGALEQAMRVEALAIMRRKKQEREQRRKARKEGLL